MKRLSLFGRTSLTVAAGLMLAQVISGAAIFLNLIVPLAQRSADDLADLLTLSARVWTELPVENRPAFEVELRDMHGVSLSQSSATQPREAPGHFPYLRYLRASLDNRLGPGGHAHVSEDAGEHFQVEFPQSGYPLHFEFSKSKMTPRPSWAMAWALLAVIGASLGLAWLLARRVTAPIRRLSEAAGKIARAEVPPRLPEKGERELAEVARVFNDMAGQLQARRDNQSTLLAGVSHDLRSPLARMKMAVGMLAGERTSPLLGRMERDIAEMDRLIGAQLELARAQERGHVEVVDLDALLDELCEAANALAPGRLRLSAREPALKIAIPPLALRRTIGNLLDNALRYGGDGQVEIARWRLNGNLYIGVRDRGPGIPPPFAEAVFRPFFRLESSRSRSSGGSGLGLAIARQLADTHGWRLAFKSRRGGGACAWLVIPGNPGLTGPDC